MHEIDGKVDSEVATKGKKINEKERPNDVYIIDSRLAWNNVPDSYAIRLTINESIAGKRVFNDKTRGPEDQYETVDLAIKKTKERKDGEVKRYKERYNVDLLDENNYDLVVDTSYSNTEELADIIIKGEEAYRKGEYYPKNWSSPVGFLPLQKGRTTGQATLAGNTIESLAEEIEQNGYNPTLGLLEIVKRDGKKYLLEGNHRTFGALCAGKTLLPYDVVAEENSNNHKLTGLTDYDGYSEYLYDYAEGIQHYGGKIGKINQLKDFSINDLLSLNKINKKRQFTNNDTGR